MTSITYTAARQNLAKVMESVCGDREPLIVTRANNESVVMLLLEEFEASGESAHLLRSPKNARRLLDAILELEGGSGRAEGLAE